MVVTTERKRRRKKKEAEWQQAGLEKAEHEYKTDFFSDAQEFKSVAEKLENDPTQKAFIKHFIS